jgi:hypothetical protein
MSGGPFHSSSISILVNWTWHGLGQYWRVA